MLQQYQDLDFALSTGMSDTDVMAKYNFTAGELQTVKEYWAQGNNLEIEKILQAKMPAEPEVEETAPVVELIPEAKPDYGYRASPRHGYVFVKRLPPTHKGRLIVPKAYESESDMGFIDACGPDVTDVNPGDLVLFDKFAETGMRFTLLDSDGDLVDLIQMLEVNVTAILTRVYIGELLQVAGAACSDQPSNT